MSDCASSCPLHDRGVDTERRRFLSTALAASVLGVLAACGDGNIGGVSGIDDDDDGGTGGGGTTGSLVVTLASFAALGADGGVARVDGGSGTPTAVLRVSATTYRAFSMVCPHAGTTVSIVSGGFRCPNHGATFTSTGAVTGGPATRGLTERAVTYNAAAGTLTIG
ncbi:MAG: ubiquinol-cytochrome c reductase iron-sulfur subunit [Gemmatimonadaceae bacterium]